MYKKFKPPFRIDEVPAGRTEDQIVTSIRNGVIEFYVVLDTVDQVVSTSKTREQAEVSLASIRREYVLDMPPDPPH